MPNQITTSAAVTTIAGSIRTTVNDVAPTRAPEVTAPMITGELEGADQDRRRRGG